MAIVAFSPLAAVLFASLLFLFQMFIVSTERLAGDFVPTEKEKEFLEVIKGETIKSIDLRMKTSNDETVAKLLELKTKLDAMVSIKDDETVKLLIKNLDELGVTVKALGEAAKPTPYKKGSIAETLSINKEKLTAFCSNKGSTLEIEHKAAAVETSTDIVTRSDWAMWHEGGRVGQIPVRRPFMKDLFRNVASTTEFIKYVDQDTVVRDAKNVALCGAINPTTKVTFKTYSIQVQKIKDFVDVCLDMMNDYAFVQGEIENLLNTSLQLKIDNDLLLGSGIAPILNGVKAQASTFSAVNADPTADYSLSVVAPNIIDLVSICGAQIKAFGKNNLWFPNAVLMNPRDVQMIKALKDGLNNYIKGNTLVSSLFQDTNGKYYIDGMLLIENPLVPQNEFYIADFTRGTVHTRPGVGIEFSYENNANFETDTVTVKVYERLNLLIRNVDKNAFMHVADIAAGLVAITKL